MSRAAESGASAQSGPCPHLPLGLRISAPRKPLGSRGRQDRTKTASLTTDPASTGARRACGGRTPAEGGPGWLPGRGQERPPAARLGGGEGLRGETRSLPPPVRYLGPAGTRPEGLPAVARTATFCRIPEPTRSPLPGPGPERRPRGSGSGGGDRSGCRGGPSAPLRTHLSARSHPTRGSYWSFRRPLDPGVRRLRGKRPPAQATRPRATGAPLARLSHRQSDPVPPWPRAAVRAPPYPPPPIPPPPAAQAQNAALTTPEISSTFGHLAKSRCQHLPGFAGLLELATGFSRIPSVAGCQQSRASSRATAGSPRPTSA